MSPEIALTLAIIFGALILFALDRLRVDVIALLVLLAVGLTGLVSAEEVFLGFANPAVITVWAVYIVSGALFKTGVADLMGQFLLKLAGSNEARLVAVIMIACGTMSAFMNNVGATAMLLPAVVAISRQTKVPVSKLLIPLAFSSLMGGNMTLIGTPANILASNILIDSGLPSFTLFEFFPTGVVIFTAGIAYMVLIGRHLIPVRTPPSDFSANLQLREYISEVRVLAGSPLEGQTLIESRFGADYDLTVLAIDREGASSIVVHRDTKIQANDLLIVKGSVNKLLDAQSSLGFQVKDEHHDLPTEQDLEGTAIIEATLAPRSHIVGRNLQEVRFRDRYGFTALAIWRYGDIITQRLRDLPLKFGDVLLLQGPRHRMPALQQGDDFLVLEPVEVEPNRRKKAWIATSILLLTLGLVIFAGYHIAIAMVIGSVLMVLSGCLTMDEAYESIDWKTVFLVAGMLPLGTAMESTGTARFLADLTTDLVGNFGPLAILAGVYVLSALITQPMSNAAAVVLMVPIAVDIAVGLGANHQPLVLAAVIGASTSFLTPVGHKANVLVFGPGGYRFFDYTRTGALLTVALLIVSMIFIPIFWPLFP